MSTAPRYDVNYDWAEGRWDHTDAATLEARVNTTRAGQSAAQDWAATAHGGAWADATTGDDNLTVSIHSSGEDAFDSIAAAADELRTAVLAADPEAQIAWVELPVERGAAE